MVLLFGSGRGPRVSDRTGKPAGRGEERAGPRTWTEERDPQGHAQMTIR